MFIWTCHLVMHLLRLYVSSARSCVFQAAAGAGSSAAGISAGRVLRVGSWTDDCSCGVRRGEDPRQTKTPHS